MHEVPKYSPEICELDHTGELPQELVETLPLNQGHPVRHRCAACAYAAGLQEGAKDAGALAVRVRELTEENEQLRAKLAGGTG